MSAVSRRRPPDPPPARAARVVPCVLHRVGEARPRREVRLSPYAMRACLTRHPRGLDGGALAAEVCISTASTRGGSEDGSDDEGEPGAAHRRRRVRRESREERLGREQVRFMRRSSLVGLAAASATAVVTALATVLAANARDPPCARTSDSSHRRTAMASASMARIAAGCPGRAAVSRARSCPPAARATAPTRGWPTFSTCAGARDGKAPSAAGPPRAKLLWSQSCSAAGPVQAQPDRVHLALPHLRRRAASSGKTKRTASASGSSSG